MQAGGASYITQHFPTPLSLMVINLGDNKLNHHLNGHFLYSCKSGVSIKRDLVHPNKFIIGILKFFF